VHLAVDDHPRLAYFKILSDEKTSVLPALSLQHLALLSQRRVKVKRVMTDNGSSFGSHREAKALHRLKIQHLRSRPYTPKTNGNAERFVQTSFLRQGAQHL
jgi:transposase InsO family protein